MKEKPFFPPPPARPREARLPKFANYTPLNANRGGYLRKLSVQISCPPREGQQLLEMLTPLNTVAPIRTMDIPQMNV